MAVRRARRLRRQAPKSRNSFGNSLTLSVVRRRHHRRGMAVAFERPRSAVRCGRRPQGRGTANSNSRREPCRTDRIACRGDAQEDAMTALVNFYNSIRRNDEGQDLLEYALLVALIAIVAVGAVTAAGTQVSNIFNQIAARHLAPPACNRPDTDGLPSGAGPKRRDDDAEQLSFDAQEERRRPGPARVHAARGAHRHRGGWRRDRGRHPGVDTSSTRSRPPSSRRIGSTRPEAAACRRSGRTGSRDVTLPSRQRVPTWIAL